MSPNLKRGLTLSAKLALLLLVGWFVRGSLLDGWSKLQSQIDAGKWSPASLRWPWLVSAAVLYVVGQFPCVVFWRLVLRSLGQRVSLPVAIRAYYVGHLGKYVPGKAMVAVMRTAMLTPHGVRPAAAVISVLYETLTTMAVGAAVAAVIVAAKFTSQPRWLFGSLAIVIVTSLPLIPPVFLRLVRKLRIRSDDGALTSEVGRMSVGAAVGGRLLLACAWLVGGLSLWATMRAAGFAGDDGFFHEWIVCTAAAALSVVVGILSLVPGGLFVREAVLLTFLEPTYGEAGALVGALLVRLAWLVAEVGISAVLYGCGTRPSERPTPAVDSVGEFPV